MPAAIMLPRKFMSGFKVSIHFCIRMSFILMTPLQATFMMKVRASDEGWFWPLIMVIPNPILKSNAHDNTLIACNREDDTLHNCSTVWVGCKWRDSLHFEGQIWIKIRTYQVLIFKVFLSELWVQIQLLHLIWCSDTHGWCKAILERWLQFKTYVSQYYELIESC